MGQAHSMSSGSNRRPLHKFTQDLSQAGCCRHERDDPNIMADLSTRRHSKWPTVVVWFWIMIHGTTVKLIQLLAVRLEITLSQEKFREVNPRMGIARPIKRGMHVHS